MRASVDDHSLPQGLPPPTARPGHDLPLLVILFGLFLLAMLLVTRLGLNAFEIFVRDAGMSADPVPVSVSIGQAALAVPQNMIRFGSERGGRQSKLDLHLHWPSLDGFTIERAGLFQSAAAADSVIYATIRPAEGAMTPEERFRRVYPRVLADGARYTAEGFVVRRFRNGFGYDDQELYIARDPVHPLFALCESAESASGSSCIGEFRIEPGLEVSYRFDRAMLGGWRQIDDRLRSLIGAFAAAGRIP